jgi:hypothetical protein
VTDLDIKNTFLLQVAKEEHSSLATTLRDRLINSVSGRKNRILKEKDDLFNIAESNAIHLHPNQFTMAHPGSPNGMHTKRSTRQRREIEDVPGFPESHKRKRKAIEDIGSPVPSKRLMENGFSTPIWTTEQVSKAMNKGNDAPAYSVEKLFTDKELTQAYSTAAHAANHYILSHKVLNEDQPPQNGNGESNSQEGERGGPTNAENEVTDSPPSAPPMERNPSHATRSTRNAAHANNYYGMDDSQDTLALPPNRETYSSVLPKIPSLTAPRKEGKDRDGRESLFRATDDEVYNDLERMRKCINLNRAEGNNGASLFVTNNDMDLLAAAVAGPGAYQGWAVARKPKLEDAVGGVPMSKQSSEMGGVAMSRQNTGEGGSSMGRRRGRQ